MDGYQGFYGFSCQLLYSNKNSAEFHSSIQVLVCGRLLAALANPSAGSFPLISESLSTHLSVMLWCSVSCHTSLRRVSTNLESNLIACRTLKAPCLSNSVLNDPLACLEFRMPSTYVWLRIISVWKMKGKLRRLKDLPTYSPAFQIQSFRFGLPMYIC